MNTEYHKWHSDNLGHEMELKIYGHAGRPFMVFPSSSGRFFDFENQGMVETVNHLIEAGRMKLIAVDSVDSQTWHNEGIHPHDRGRRHEDYDRYIVEEVVPFINKLPNNSDVGIITTGVSMGAYHAANFLFRHPDCFGGCVALSGVYHVRDFVGDYMDDYSYFNSPTAFLPGIEDDWYLSRYRNANIIVCVGQGAWEDNMLADTRELQSILAAKNIPAWIDYWGTDVNHDWPWWLKQFPHFAEKVT